MMAQYFALKDQAPDCLLFYRMGDFFELFFRRRQGGIANARHRADQSRGEHGGQPVPMCGVPVHAAEGYLARLIKAGHRVAIAEQTESARRSQSARRIKDAGAIATSSAFVTAGTLTEDIACSNRCAVEHGLWHWQRAGGETRVWQRPTFRPVTLRG
jgi:DNA mismatch repair protein MutS